MSLTCENDPTECEFRNNMILVKMAFILKYIKEYGDKKDEKELDKLFVYGINSLYHGINQKVIDANRREKEIK